MPVIKTSTASSFCRRRFRAASIPPIPSICISRKIMSKSLSDASSSSPVAKSLMSDSGFCFFINPCICWRMNVSSSTTAMFKNHHPWFCFIPSLNLSADFLWSRDTGNERHSKWSERHIGINLLAWFYRKFFSHIPHFPYIQYHIPYIRCRPDAVPCHENHLTAPDSSR